MINLSSILFLIPLIFALFIGINVFLKNPILIRRITNFALLLTFISSSIIFTYFSTNSFSSHLVMISSLIILLFSIISKKIIIKMHRGFYSSILLLLGLVNFSLLTDNIFAFLLSIFWIFLLFYFLSISFSQEKTKKEINIVLFGDIFWFLCATFLLLKGFARYFIINDIAFNFNNISTYIYKVDDLSITLAFYGFLIIISRLFNFIPFCTKNITTIHKTTSLVHCLRFFIHLLLGCYLFEKCYSNFNFLFYQNQNEIAVFLLVNFIIFSILSIKQNNMFKFLANSFCAYLIVGLFSIFSFEKECYGILIYFILALCISYCFSAFVFLISENIFKTNDFSEIKANGDSKSWRLFTLISLLNISLTPFLTLFGAILISLIAIFSTNYEANILNIIPYILVIGIAILSLNGYNIIHKILIESQDKKETKASLSYHQIIVLSIFSILIILYAFLSKTIINHFDTIAKIENF